MTSAKSLATVEITDSNTRRQQVTEGGVEVDAETGKKIYKGKMQEIGLVHSKRAGPMKNVENLRVTVRFDYAPDICKDYKYILLSVIFHVLTVQRDRLLRLWR